MRRRPNGFTIIDLILLNLIVALIMAIGIPNFIKFQSRSKQAEAKANLRALYYAEKAYFQEKDTFTPLVDTVGFNPERGNRYQYNLNAWSQDNLQDRTGTQPVHHLGPPGDDGIAVDHFKFPVAPVNPLVNPSRTPLVIQQAVGSFTAGAIGWVDEGATPDVWTISSVDYRSRGGKLLAGAGVPYNDEPCSTCGP